MKNVTDGNGTEIVGQEDQPKFVQGVKGNKGRSRRWVHLDVHIESGAVFVNGNRMMNEAEENIILNILVGQDYLEYAPTEKTEAK